MKIEISAQDFINYGSYHFSYPKMLDRVKQGLCPIEPISQVKEFEQERENPKSIGKKKINIDDYDVDDPFIDDAEVTTQYESIFQLDPEAPLKDTLPDLNFYVYRGELQVDVIEK